MKATRILPRGTPRSFTTTSQTSFLPTRSYTHTRILSSSTQGTRPKRGLQPQHTAGAYNARAPFSTTRYLTKGLQPDSADPAPPKPESSLSSSHGDLFAAELSDSEYHELADQYLDSLVFTAEELAESGDDAFEVEYAVCSLKTPLQFPYLYTGHVPAVLIDTRLASSHFPTRAKAVT